MPVAVVAVERSKAVAALAFAVVHRQKGKGPREGSLLLLGTQLVLSGTPVVRHRQLAKLQEVELQLDQPVRWRDP